MQKKPTGFCVPADSHGLQKKGADRISYPESIGGVLLIDHCRLHHDRVERIIEWDDPKMDVRFRHLASSVFEV